MESTLKDQLVTRINTKIDKLSNDRVVIRNFDEIKTKKVSNAYVFYHPNYSKVI